MKLDYTGDCFTLTCPFNKNHVLEGLDKRWSKAKRHWRIYNARINRDKLRALRVPEVTATARAALEEERAVTGGAVKHIMKTDPYGFQTAAVRKMLDAKKCALFAPVGSGKTKIAIDALQSLWAAGEIDQILIIGLVSLRENWRAEIEKHWLGEPPWLNMWITGIESYSAGKLYNDVRAWITPRTAMVVDESSKIKNMRAKRTERVVEIGEHCTYKYAMTGTPILNGNVDLFAQFRFLDKDIIGIQTFIGFRNRYCIMGGFKGKQISGYRKQGELLEALRDNSFVIEKKEAMPFLPSQTFLPRRVTMNPEQKRLVGRLKKEMVSEANKKEVKVENVLTQMLRVSQMAGGFSEDGLPIKGTNPKLKELNDIIEDSPEEPMVIFCRFIPELKMLLDVLPDSAAIYGDVKPKVRQEIVDDFQAGKYKYIICQYAVGAMGINLYRARITVFFSFDFSLEFWEQSIGRVARMQQKRPMVYIPIIAKGSTDIKVYRALQNKETIASMVTNALRTKSLDELI